MVAVVNGRVNRRGDEPNLGEGIGHRLQTKLSGQNGDK